MFDDLTVENYVVVYDPLPFDKIGLIVEKLAKYHALSLVLIERGHEEIKDLKMVFSEEMRHMFSPMTRVMLQLAKEIQTWSGYEELAQKIIDYIPILPDIMMKHMKRDYSPFYNVLNHGDFHIRNLMFKKTDEGELSEVIFLDFQMPQYNVPSFDFNGLLISMGNEEVRRRQNEVIKMYHRFLLTTLKTYGYKGEPPTIIDIHTALLQTTEYQAFYTFIVGPMFRLRGFELGVLFQPEEDKDLVAALDVIFKDPVFVEDIKLSLDKFEALGVFDVTS